MFGIKRRFQRCKDWPKGSRSPPYECIKFGYSLQTRGFCYCRPARERLQIDIIDIDIDSLASPAIGHWGTCPPPRLPASYFGDHSLYRLTSHAHGFLSSRAFSGYRFCRGKFKLCHFFCPEFSWGSNYSSQNARTIANKFQLHTYFWFR